VISQPVSSAILGGRVSTSAGGTVCCHRRRVRSADVGLWKRARPTLATMTDGRRRRIRQCRADVPTVIRAGCASSRTPKGLPCKLRRWGSREHSLRTLFGGTYARVLELAISSFFSYPRCTRSPRRNVALLAKYWNWRLRSGCGGPVNRFDVHPQREAQFTSKPPHSFAECFSRRPNYSSQRARTWRPVTRAARPGSTSLVKICSSCGPFFRRTPTAPGSRAIHWSSRQPSQKLLAPATNRLRMQALTTDIRVSRHAQPFRSRRRPRRAAHPPLSTTFNADAARDRNAHRTRGTIRTPHHELPTRPSNPPSLETRYVYINPNFTKTFFQAP